MTLSVSTNYVYDKNNAGLNRGQASQKHGPSFRAGFTDSCIAMTDYIGTKGLMGTYVVQDLFGMVIPRVGAGYFRNSNKTGEGNKSFALLEAVREIISGPSLFIIPWIILSNVKRFAGKVYEVPISMTSDLQALFEKFANEHPDMANMNGKEAKKQFYDFVFKDIISQTGGGNIAESQLLAGKAARVGELDARKVFVSSGKKKESSKCLSDIHNAIVEMNKNSGKQSSELSTMFMSGSGKDKVKIGDIRNFTALLTDYTEDIFSKLEKQKNNTGFEMSEFIKKFHNKAKVGRFVLNISMFAAIVGFFTQIPKLYKSVSKTNPGMKGLIPETDKVEIAQAEVKQK